MHLVVLMAGVADTRYPLESAHLERKADGQPAAIFARMLSPFDDAALEIALKLRDANPATAVTVALLEQPGDESLARALASYRPETLMRVDASAIPTWDPVAASAALHWVVKQCSLPVDLVLLGREFGDTDDGAIAPALAERLGWRYASQIQALAARDGQRLLVREQAMLEQAMPMLPATVASVTNDRRNRLRHPLFKNVAAAKRAALPDLLTPVQTAKAGVSIEDAALATSGRRAAQCRLIAGTVSDQALALARYLRTGAHA